jgi:peptide/nickel transport system substrate-binding protein
MRTQSPFNQPVRALYNAFVQGQIDRRTFVTRLSALGLGTAMTVFLANQGAAAQGASPEASPAASPVAGGGERPAAGTENQERGAGPALSIIQWQAPTILSPHVSSGVKDFLAATLVLEPLIHYLPDSTLVPNLLTEIPSVENGGLSEDLTEVTLRLLPDVLWSDGEPFTAEDVVFTINWVLDPENASVSFGTYEAIESAEAVDEQTVHVTFSAPNPFWVEPFAGTSTGFVYPKHILEAGPEAHNQFLSNPIGTGPYVVDSFSPNDQVTYSINENYREPTKPFFSTVNLKGGGDAAAAGRAVLQTGEYHFAWNLQIEPDVLETMIGDESGPGVLVAYPGANVERFNFNFTDPWTEVNGQRSEASTSHPFFTDDAVREAISTAIDRQQIADAFYGFGQSPAVNAVYGDPRIASENTSWEYNPEKAAQILEDAGWVMEGDVRAKDGVELRIVYATSVNAVRQKTQAVIKSNLEAIGIAVQLEQVDAGIYFDASPGTEQNIYHFYWDVNMYQSVPTSTRPIAYMEAWYAGEDNSNFAQEANQWNAENTQRWANEEFDAAYEQALTEPDPEVLADLFIKMNDLVINNHVIVPLVVVGSPRGASRALRQENLALAPFSYDYWNIANWNFEEGVEGF